MTVLHNSLTAIDLHVPQGVDPTPLQLVDGIANAYIIQNNLGTPRDILNISTASNAYAITFGNTTDFSAAGANVYNFLGTAHLLANRYACRDHGGDPASLVDITTLYAKDSGGTIHLFALDGDGTSHQLTPLGQGVDLDHVYDEGRTVTVDVGPIDLDVSTTSAGALDVDVSGPIGSSVNVLDVRFSGGPWTGIPSGLYVDYSGMSSLNAASDLKAFNAVGKPNVGAGNSIGVFVEAFDIGIKVNDSAPVEAEEYQLRDLGGNPSNFLNAAQLFAKNQGGTIHLHALDGDGTVHQLTPPGGGGTLDTAYNSGDTITADSGPVVIDVSTTNGRALDLNIDGPLSSSVPAIDIDFGSGAWTNTPHGLSIDYSGMTSLSDNQDTFGVELVGKTNSGAGLSVGLYSTGFDVDLHLNNSNTPFLKMDGKTSLLIGTFDGTPSGIGTSCVLIGNDVGNLRTGTGTANVLIGYQATIPGDTTANVTVIGAQAQGAASSVAVGKSALASGANAISFGATSQATNTRSIAIGDAAVASAARAISIGGFATSAFANSIALGRSATTTKTNQMVVGSSSFSVTELVFGNGATAAVPSATVTFKATNGSGANVNASDLVIAPGSSTGSGDMGNVKFQSGAEIASATTVNTLEDRFELTPEYNRWRGQGGVNGETGGWVMNVSGVGQTSGSGTDDVVTFAAGGFGNGSWIVKYTVQGVVDDAGTVRTVQYHGVAGLTRDSGTLALSSGINPVELFGLEDAVLTAASATITISGDNILLRVTGVATYTIEWSGHIVAQHISDGT